MTIPRASRCRKRMGNTPTLRHNIAGQRRRQCKVERTVIRGVQVGELSGPGHQEGIERCGRCGLNPEPPRPRNRNGGLVRRHARQDGNPVEELFLKVRGAVLGPLLLWDAPRNLGPRACSRRKDPVGKDRPFRRAGGLLPAALQEQKAFSDPPSQFIDRLRAQAVTARVAARVSGSTRVAEQIIPRALEQFHRNDGVASPCATKTGTPASRAGATGTPASNGSVP